MTDALRVLVAMSGGVDSSVAAALLLEEGYDVVGVTLKLWGGPSDSGCCSVADVDDARRVADRLGIDHHVFNLGDAFDTHVVAPYVDAHVAGRTPNPCVECNRHVKFDLLLQRADVLGFDLLATGHHARIAERPDGTRRVARGADLGKDQSYVVHMLGQRQLARLRFPVGHLTKEAVRDHARRMGLRTADKPDSQDVCFITASAGRRAFLGSRIPLRPATVVDTSGAVVGAVDAVELVTIGQRTGLDLAGGAARRYVVDVDPAAGTVVVGGPEELLAPSVRLDALVWADAPVQGPVLAQVSAHGEVAPARFADGVLTWEAPRRRVAPGQSVVLYEGDEVVGAGTAEPGCVG
ncbi:MAG: tRNA 2-thiouridine(34) synthase MnmA [Acidimicrobiales bacterium]|nr:tRNA 2-thiouridine(34) synthase MnmA [Acidimicrobiales bacterium]